MDLNSSEVRDSDDSRICIKDDIFSIGRKNVTNMLINDNKLIVACSDGNIRLFDLETVVQQYVSAETYHLWAIYESFMNHGLLRITNLNMQSLKDNLGSITEATETHKITSKSLTVLKVRFDVQDTIWLAGDSIRPIRWFDDFSVTFFFIFSELRWRFHLWWSWWLPDFIEPAVWSFRCVFRLML